SLGSGIIWEGSEGVALLEEICHWGWALRFQKSMPGSHLFLCLLPTDKDAKLSATSPAQHLPASCHDENGLNL
ncbi:mCG1042685, partial [Mus musculus]